MGRLAELSLLQCCKRSDGSDQLVVELMSATGTLLGSATSSIPAGNSFGVSYQGQDFSGFARCRFTTNYASATIRGNLTVFHALSGSTALQIYAVYEAR
jgi:hypothetical protein